MFKKLFSTAALLFGVGSYLFAQQPQIVNFMHQGDSCWANATGHFISTWGSVSNATSGMTATIYWGDGSSDNTNVSTQSSSGWFNGGHNYSTQGAYTVMAVLFDASNNAVDSSQFSLDAYCNVLHGWMYKRNDANCTYDLPTDDPINAYREIEVRKNNVPIDTFVAGYYYYYNIPNPDLTSEFSLHPLTGASNGYTQVCPSTSTIYKVRLDTLDFADEFNYGYDCGSSTGFDLFVYASGFLRFVNNSYITIQAGNTYCTPQSGTVTLNIDPQYTFSGSTPSPASVSGQIVTWNLSNLTGSSYTNIWVTLTATDTLNPGDTSCSTVSISPTAGDVNTANNTFSYCDIIHASMDPNDKKVSPMASIAAGDELTYTINFENMGNDTAFNVHILDTLADQLDPNSFKVLSSSHPVRTALYDYGSTKVARFDFAGINLGDKDHPASNKGFVIYKAKSKSNLSPGTEIKNTAHIYFDINPAIVTNTVVSTIPGVNSIPGITKEDGLSVFPNPVNKILYLENKNGSYSKALLLNAVGQVVITQPISKGMNRIETGGLAPGVYYLLVNGNAGSRSMKIVKP